MMTMRSWMGCAMAGALLGGCVLGEDLDDLDDTMAIQDLSPGACTSVKITAPTNNFMGNAGTAVTVTAVATCPAGSTPEYQLWGKMAGAANWAILGSYVP